MKTILAILVLLAGCAGANETGEEGADGEGIDWQIHSQIDCTLLEKCLCSACGNGCKECVDTDGQKACRSCIGTALDRGQCLGLIDQCL